MWLNIISVVKYWLIDSKEQKEFFPPNFFYFFPVTFLKITLKKNKIIHWLNARILDLFAILLLNATVTELLLELEKQAGIFVTFHWGGGGG